jgi:hypothetical protein
MAHRIPASILNRAEADGPPVSGGMVPGKAPTKRRKRTSVYSASVGVHEQIGSAAYTTFISSAVHSKPHLNPRTI